MESLSPRSDKTPPLNNDERSEAKYSSCFSAPIQFLADCIAGIFARLGLSCLSTLYQSWFAAKAPAAPETDESGKQNSSLAGRVDSKSPQSPSSKSSSPVKQEKSREEIKEAAKTSCTIAKRCKDESESYEAPSFKRMQDVVFSDLEKAAEEHDAEPESYGVFLGRIKAYEIDCANNLFLAVQQKKAKALAAEPIILKNNPIDNPQSEFARTYKRLKEGGKS